MPIGLGSGVNAVAAARDALGVDCEVVGVVSARARAYQLSFERGEIVESPASTQICDGMACRTPNAEAMDGIWRSVARIVSVSDSEVAEAIRFCFSATHNVAEGAGAAALAAALKEEQDPERAIGIVLSGGNVDRALYARVLAGESFGAETA